MKKLVIFLVVVLLSLVASCDINIDPEQRKNNDKPTEELSNEPTKDELMMAEIDEITLPSETKVNLQLDSYVIIQNTFLNIDWVSSNPDVINIRGGITRGNEDVSVHLTAHFYSNKGFSYDKEFTVIVLAYTTMDRLEKALSEIRVDEYLTTDSTLPTQVSDHEISVSWVSNHPEIIDETGVIELPTTQTSVHLTLTLRVAGAELVQEYDVIAFKQGEYQSMNTFNVLNKKINNGLVKVRVLEIMRYSTLK